MSRERFESSEGAVGGGVDQAGGRDKGTRNEKRRKRKKNSRNEFMRRWNGLQEKVTYVTQKGVLDKYKTLSAEYEKYKQLEAENKHKEASELLENNMIGLARHLGNKFRYLENKRLSKPCFGVSDKSAEELFNDDTSLGSISSEEGVVHTVLVGTKQDESITKEEKVHKTFEEPKSKPTPAKKANKSKKKKTGRKKGGWWTDITENDPITMEPIAELPYPPFVVDVQTSPKESAHRGGSSKNSVVHYFDGKTLAHYIVSTGNFNNPNNRQPLTRSQCLKLDQYLKQHELPPANITMAFDLSKKVRVEANSNGAADRAEALRRNATVIMASMFNFSPPQDQPQGRVQGQSREPDRFYGSSISNSVIHSEGNMRVIDDNEWVEHSALEDEEMFPAMPSPSARGTLQTMSPWQVEQERRREEERQRLESSGPRFIPQQGAPIWPGRGNTNLGGSSVPGSRDFPSLGGDAGAGRSTGPTGNWRAKVATAPAGVAQPRQQQIGAQGASETARPKLALLPRTTARTESGAQATSSRSIFGTAKPREQVLAKQGVDWKSQHEYTHERTSTTLLSPYTPSMFETAQKLGVSFVAKIERDLLTFVQAPTSTKSFSIELGDPTKQGFVRKLGKSFYGLDVEMLYNGATSRQLVFYKTAHSFPPEVTLVQAMLDFEDEYSSYKRMDNAKMAESKDFSIGFFGVTMKGRGGRLTASKIEQSLSTFARPSTFFVRRLDNHNVIAEFSERTVARRTFANLRTQALHGVGDLSWTQLQWWPMSPEWAIWQLEFRDKRESTAKQKRRNDRQPHDTRRQASVMAGTGWDEGAEVSLDSNPVSPRAEKMPPRAKKTQGLQATCNVWSQLETGDSDED
mmetsp:Transcript_39538/g.64055  ORF Transcript_39538/g.64055 Transcript_39538/m.64055 type:complete len:859 (-) Transcript_39538:4211-6787(-)